MKKAFIFAAAAVVASLFLACVVEAAPEGTGFEVLVDFGARSVTDDVNVSSVLVQAYDQDDNLLDEDTVSDQPWKAFITIDPSDYGSILFTAQALGSGESVLYSGELLITIGSKTSPSLSITVSARDYISSTIGTLKYVPAGSFQRDSDAANISILSQPYRMSQTEITREQWRAIFGDANDPSDTFYSSNTNDPVQRTNWYHAIAFCNKLSLAEGLSRVYEVSIIEGDAAWTTLTFADIPTISDGAWDSATETLTNTGYRLPTEMEWMWAAMGANEDSTAVWVYEVNTTGYAKAFAGSTGSNVIGNYAVFGYYHSDAGRTTTERSNPVGSKIANELGLYDMSGNVLEWCWDWYADNGTGMNYAVTGNQTDYRGAASGVDRVGRGGRWSTNASECTVAVRDSNGPIAQHVNVGFRVVRP